MSDNKPTIIDLLRHGKPCGGEIFRGSTDVELSPEGLLQMQAAVAKLHKPQHIISSPLQRCHDFAASHAADCGISLQLEPQFAELSFGDWDGQSFAHVKEHYPELFHHYWQDPIRYSPPNAEPMAEFRQRVVQALWRWVELHRGEHLLWVIHGGVIRAILSEILQTQAVALMRYDVPYASISQIRIYHDGDRHYPQLVFHNA